MLHNCGKDHFFSTPAIKLNASEINFLSFQGLIIVITLDCLFCWLDVFYELDYIFDNEYDIKILPLPIWNFLITYVGPTLLRKLATLQSSYYFQAITVANPIFLVVFSKMARQEVFRWFCKPQRRRNPFVRTVTIT